MKRNGSLEEISDGRLYGWNDMVKADCHGCPGCHKCCTGMGNSVVLDPYDVKRLTEGTGVSFQQLLSEGKVELQVVDGCILPNLRMAGEEEACAFLDHEGRCGIHEYRPGICRLFPLGRYYENGDFKYILLTGECIGRNPSKIKVGKWIDMPEHGKHHRFLCDWHYLLIDVEKAVTGREDSDFARKINMALLEMFYLSPDTGQDFYEDFASGVTRFRQSYLSEY
ncbi:MAG: YkgJ family cysteine cluster protein [Acetatifactor sp.]